MKSDSTSIPVMEEIVFNNNGETNPRKPRKAMIIPVTCISLELLLIIRSILYYSLNKSFNIKPFETCNMKKYKILLLTSPFIGFVVIPLLLCEVGIVCNDLIASIGGWILLLYGVPLLGWLLARKINKRKKEQGIK